jgi:sugar phosphate isomerase/epimerase
MTELFIMSPEVNVGSFEQAFESSAFLGATSVNAVAYDRDRPRLENNYGRFCELASSYGLGVITEIHRKLTHNSLKAAVDFFGPLGVDVKVELDVLHFYRYGGKTDEISNYRHWIARAQMCDGPQQASDAEYEMQALFHRQMPGYGALPLVEFFAALPVDIVIGVEVPNSSYRTDERIQLAFAESRRILQQADALRPQAGAADFRYE